MTEETFARDLRILRRHLDGETLADIGSDLGISRERVRQIVAKFGAKSKREISASRCAEMLAAIRKDNLTANEAAARFGVSFSSAYRVGRLAGHVFRRDILSESAHIAALAEQVRAGASIYSLAKGSMRGLLFEHCKRHGIKSRHGRHRDFGPRRETVLRMREQGHGWGAIAAEVSRIEGAAVRVAAVYFWASKNIGHQGMRAVARSAKVKPPKATARQKIKPQVIVCEDAKEAARANYGKAPASAIAAAHGVTRNSIIGHWFRLRRSGQIAEVNTAHKIFGDE